MSGSGKEVLPTPAPSGPGRGRPKKVRPRENEAVFGVGGIGAEVKRRRKLATAGGETGELGASTTGAPSENEIIVLSSNYSDQPNTRVGARSQKHPMNKRKQNAVQAGGSDGGMGLAQDHGREGESQEEGKDTALDVVLKVHGVVVHATEVAATFPGEIGQDYGGESNLCACCSKPEVLRQTIVCDGCERSFHIICLNLPLQSASEVDDWICTSCSDTYPESEGAAGVSKAVREDIERRLFTRERKTSSDAVVGKELRGKGCSSLDYHPSVEVVPATSEQIAQHLDHTTGPDVPDGDQHRQECSNQSVLPETGSLDLNEVNTGALEGSFGKSFGADSDRSRASDFEEEISKVEETKLPEAKGGTANDIVLPDSREPCTNLTETCLAQSASKIVESSERMDLAIAEVASGANDVVLSATAGNSTVSDGEMPCNIAESCVEGSPRRPIAEATSMVEGRLPVTLEELQVTDATRSIIPSAGRTVADEEKLTGSSSLEGITSVSDSKLPFTLEEREISDEIRLADVSGEPTCANEEKLVGHSVGEEISPVVESKLSGSTEEREDSSTSRSMTPTEELTAAKEIKQACPVVPTEADDRAVESGRLQSANTPEAAHVDASGVAMVQETSDFRNCITGDNLGQDGFVSTAKHSDNKEKRARKNGNKLLDHFHGGIVSGVSKAVEPMEVSELEFASRNALSTLPRVATSPTSSADVATVRPEWQQSKKSRKQSSSPVRHADRASNSNVGLNGILTREPIEEPSPLGPEDPQLKKIGADSLQQLRDYIKEKHGLWLADGWEVDVRRRRNEKHLDKYFISPEMHRFRSRVEVMKHLGLWDGSRCSFKLEDGSKGKCEVQHTQPKEWLSLVQRLAKGRDELMYPFMLGDLTIESLGVIDLRPGYWNDLHIWPVGYRCTWHDPTTSSFCVSEVADGGSSQPIFRVTRKYCPTVAGLADSNGDALNVNSECSDVTMKDLRTVKDATTTASVDNISCVSHGAKNQYGSVSDVEEEESLKALLGDIDSFPSSGQYENVKFSGESRKVDETRKSGTEVVSEDRDGSELRDFVGEFFVEASSTAEVWRLYAEQFVERCRKVSDDCGLLLKMCPHETTATVEPVPAENLDPKDLWEHLGEDRFGLNQTLVIGLIERLTNSDKCSGYKFLKERGLSWRAEDPVEVNVQPPQRFRIREKARKHRKAPEVLVEESIGAAEPVDVNGKDEVVVPIFAGERPPPPPGQSLGLRLPSQYVGDVLQIWEFLSRFSNLIGFAQPPLLEDLEEGLTCGSASVKGCVDPSETMTSNKKFESDRRRDTARDDEFPDMAPRSINGEASGSPRTPMKSLLPGRTQLSSTMHGSQQKDVGRMERLWEDEVKAARYPSNDTNSLMDVEPNHDNGEAFGADMNPKSSDSKVMGELGLASAASLHVPLIKFLLSDLQSKVCGFEELPGESEESKHKRGRKRIRDTGSNLTLGREKLIGSFSINEVTWPEVARRYIISLSRIAKIAETADYRREECMKILRCIQGDGGVLCGALDGVAGMEIDAQLLAEAEKEISTMMPGNEDTAAPTTPPQNSTSRDLVEDARGQDSSGECALWVKLLDPIAKLPTNVGSRIRNRVIDALAANPPAWAAEMLEYSISKKVYKGNASGPTKRAVMEVLHRYRGEDPDPKVKKTKKQRKRVLPSPEVVMQRCRIVLRQVATADTLRVVSKTYRCMTHFYESEREGLLARPLDFRAIDLRLGAGAYGTSPDAFAADVKQIWRNVASLYENGSIEASAAVELSELFNSLFNKQVIVFQRGGDQASVTEPGGKNAGLSNEESEQKATEEKPPGSDANKPVKAPWEDDSCQVCGIDDDHDNVLLCDGCDAEYHIYCLNPPLSEVPDGNWFCHSCVAVDTGFLEAPSAPESRTEPKALDKQDEHHQMRGHYFEDIGEKDQLRRLDVSAPAPLREIALKLADTDYWHLTLAERVYLLKWLCDQALETPKARSHLEKSMEVAGDLQQRLRTLLVERRRSADLGEARPDSSKDGTREVNILPVFQSRGANSKRPDEFDEESSVQVDVVDGLSVSGLSTGTVGISRVVQSHPSEFVGHAAPLGTGVDRSKDSSGSLASAKLSRGEHEEQDIAADQTRHYPVLEPMEVDILPNSAVTRNFGQLKEGFVGGIHACNSETIIESDDLQVVGTPNGLTADRSRKNAESLVQSNPQVVVEPRKLSFTSWDDGLDLIRKYPKDEPFSCPEVEVEVGGTTLLWSTGNLLDAEIEKIKTKLMLVNSRRDLLGRDDTGRMYWGLCGSKTTPWLAVETAEANNQCQVEYREGLAAGEEVVLPVDSKTQKDDISEKRGHPSRLTESLDGSTSHVQEKDVLVKEGQDLPWSIYSNEAVLDQLIEWLSPTSNQEKMLKATLLQWRSLLLLYRGSGAEQVGGLREELSGRFVSRGYGSKTTGNLALASQVVAKSKRGAMPALKASCLLEWRYRQSSDSLPKGSSAPGLSKRGRKKKTQQASKISRCPCLEPIWASRCHCLLCHTTYETELEFQAHTSGGSCRNAGGKSFDQQGDIRSGKKSGHSSKSLSSTKALKSALPQQPSVGIIAPPDVSKMPMVICESMRDRINRIGCIADKGPIFTPGLAISPAFDPALMMVDSSLEPMLLKAGGSVSAQGILGTIAVGATSCISHGEDENSLTGFRILVSSSEDLPGRLIEVAEVSEAVKATDHTHGRSSVPIAGSPVQEHAGPFSLDVKGLTTKEEVQLNHTQSAASAPSLGRTLSGAYDQPYEPNGHLSLYKAYSRNFKVTGKQLTIPEASLRPLEAEEDLDILQQLKVRLLDIEAAVTPDMTENARGYSRRRQAWRSLLKLAKSIYTMVQAIVLLEQMICADFLRTSWCYWSSFTVAAKTATLSSLYLRVYALDAAIEYEKSESYAGVDLTSSEGKQGKKDNEREDKKNSQNTKFPARKKKKEEVILIP